MEFKNFFNSIKGKVLVVGIGNPLRGDDAVGSYIVRSMDKNLRIPLINCEDAPEKYLDKIIQYRPDVIIFIDALEMKAPPGCVCLISDKDLESSIILTHRIPLKLIAKYIKAKIQTEILVIGIQPKSREIGLTMSEEVLESAEFLKKLLVERFG